jgi:probable phosphoglycerate mutase
MTRLLLVRHGESTWNASGRWQGWADAPLSDLGRRQAEAAGRSLGAVDAIACSDLGRARSTADILAEAIGVGPVEVVPGLRERNVGDWTGLTRPEIEAGWPGALARAQTATTVAPGGEDNAALMARVVPALLDVAAEHADGEVLVVSHGGVIRVLVRHLGGEPWPVPNLGGVVLSCDVDRGDLRLVEPLLLIDPDDVAVTVPRQL